MDKHDVKFITPEDIMKASARVAAEHKIISDIVSKAPELLIVLGLYAAEIVHVIFDENLQEDVKHGS